jgi:hypothetical protein
MSNLEGENEKERQRQQIEFQFSVAFNNIKYECEDEEDYQAQFELLTEMYNQAMLLNDETESEAQDKGKEVEGSFLQVFNTFEQDFDRVPKNNEEEVYPGIILPFREKKHRPLDMSIGYCTGNGCKQVGEPFAYCTMCGREENNRYYPRYVKGYRHEDYDTDESDGEEAHRFWTSKALFEKLAADYDASHNK